MATTLPPTAEPRKSRGLRKNYGSRPPSNRQLSSGDTRPTSPKRERAQAPVDLSILLKNDKRISQPLLVEPGLVTPEDLANSKRESELTLQLNSNPNLPTEKRVVEIEWDDKKERRISALTNDTAHSTAMDSDPHHFSFDMSALRKELKSSENSVSTTSRSTLDNEPSQLKSNNSHENEDDDANPPALSAKKSKKKGMPRRIKSDRKTLEELTSRARDQTEDHANYEMEIAPGHYVQFRGAHEVREAMAQGCAADYTCFECGLNLVSVRDCEHVICPDCHMVNPVFDVPDECIPYGAGMGLKKEWIGEC